MRWLFAIVLCALALALVEAQRFNNFNNNNNFRQNNFRQPQNNFRQFNNNNNNGRTFNFNNNNNNNNNNRGSPRGTNPNFAFGLDTSDGRYAKFEGPVRGIPRDHGGGRFGAADCLLCPNGRP